MIDLPDVATLPQWFRPGDRVEYDGVRGIVVRAATVAATRWESRGWDYRPIYVVVTVMPLTLVDEASLQRREPDDDDALLQLAAAVMRTENP